MATMINVKRAAVNSAVMSGVDSFVADKAREMMELHTKYGHNATLHGETACIKTWLENKAGLMELLSKHPDWNAEKNYIVFPHDFVREIDSYEVRRFFDTIISWYDERKKNRIRCFYADLVECYSTEDDYVPHWKASVTSAAEEMLKVKYPELKGKAGMKLSRLVNRFMTDVIKANEHSVTQTVYEDGEYRDKEMKPYNKLFARFADAINPTRQTRFVVISVNPVDYATMSFGNSWSSCHTIDTQNIRNSKGTHYHGMYCGGTLSYMLDTVSAVVYTVDGSYKGNEYEYQDKITRQMIHINPEGAFLQSRLYPQSSDGGTDLYKVYREIEQDVLSKCFGEVNDWWVKKGTSGMYNFAEGACDAHHYEDYVHFSDVHRCVLKSKANGMDDFEWRNGAMTVGHVGIDIATGDDLDGCEVLDGRLTSEILCAGCGCVIQIGNDDENRWIEGEYYCEDCVQYCEYCDRWELYENMTEVHYRYGTGMICEYGLEREISRGNLFQCEDCGEVYDANYNTGLYDGNGDAHCEDCVEGNYVFSEYEDCLIAVDEAVWIKSESDYRYEIDCAVCEECGEWFVTDDMVHRNGNWYCKNCAE